MQVLDLATVGSAVDEAFFVEKARKAHREPGTTVTVKKSKLSGLPASHLEVTSHDKDWDVFLQKRGSLLYGLLIMGPKRDPKLIAKAKAGLRIGKSD